ncbi:MAG: hypothetical protein F9K40_13930 [Kofleriaceae bacterium]|nr:MAG: hypothetical protein F9K40_13930 [Kofleriaceae bacterium]
MQRPELTGEFAVLMGWADETRRLKVRANAETPSDARAARLGFTPSGRLVSCDRRGLLRVWDPATGATGVVATPVRAAVAPAPDRARR